MNIVGAFFFGFCVSMLSTMFAALCDGLWVVAGGIATFLLGVVLASALCAAAGRPRG